MNPSKGTEEDNSLNPEASFWCQVMLLDLKYTRPLNVGKGFRFGVSFAMSHVYIKRKATFRQTFGILTERMFPSASLEQIVDQKAAVGAGWRPRTKTSYRGRWSPKFPWFAVSMIEEKKRERRKRAEVHSLHGKQHQNKTKFKSAFRASTYAESTAHDCCAFSTSDIKCPCVLLISTEHKVSGDKHSICEQVLHPTSRHSADTENKSRLSAGILRKSQRRSLWSNGQ